MTRHTIIAAGLVFAGASALTGCNNGMKDENAQLRSENEALRAKLATEQEARAEAERLARMRAEAAAKRQASAADTSSTAASPNAPLQTIEFNTPTPGPSKPAPPATPQPQTYVVQKGDTLSHIALRIDKDATLWPVIHSANRQAIGAAPERLKIGMKLVIPPKPQS